MRERLVSRELNPRLTTLPDKFQTIHDHQIDAVTEIVEAFDEGQRVVVLEAPTGSGKTVIAEIVRRMLDTRACYVCHNKDLQEQFAGDFPYARVLYGRDNYAPIAHPEMGSCGDCTWNKARPVCVLCDNSHESCPYVKARAAAMYSPVPVLNSAYWLNEVMAVKSRFANTGLVVFDEADTLEGVLMGQVEVYVGERTQGRYGIRPPRFVTKEDSYLEWAGETLGMLEGPLKKLGAGDFHSIQQAREVKRLERLVAGVEAMANDLVSGVPWVYTGGAGRRKTAEGVISFKPVKVDRFGAKRIWDRDKRFLLMSATIVSPGQLVESLGWTDAYKYVTVESQFHAKNRQVVVRPVANMTRKGLDDAGRNRVLDAVRDTLQRHEGERGLVHSVSYALANLLQGACELERPGRVFSYRSARDRARAISGFKETAASVLVAPSADRGVDLPGELCRFQIIAKVPYASLGDKQVEKRLYRTNDGKIWFNVEVARSIMQMVGRGVRSEDDYCVCYVLDEDFARWYRAWGHLFPRWFRKGLRFE